MPMSDMSETEPKPLDIWTRRTAAILFVLLLGTLSYLVWRISMVAYRIEQGIVATTADVKQVTRTAADISRQIGEISEDVKSIKGKAEEALRLDEIENILDEAIALKNARHSGKAAPTGEVESEIRFLLSSIGRSGCKFEYSGKVRSARRFYAHLYAKYKLYQKTIASAEEFIEKVATKTIAGNPYSVILAKDKRQNLNAWLLQALKQQRESRRP